MLDISVTLWVAKSRPDREHHSARGSRELECPIPLAHKLLEAIENSNPTAVLASINDTLNDMYEAYLVQDASGGRKITNIDRKARAVGSRSESKMDLHQLVLAIVVRITNEETKKWDLDYFKLFRECWTMLTKLTAMPDVDRLLRGKIHEAEVRRGACW